MGRRRQYSIRYLEACLLSVEPCAFQMHVYIDNASSIVAAVHWRTFPSNLCTTLAALPRDLEPT